MWKLFASAFIAFFIVTSFIGSVVAQKQLIILKNEKVILRLYPGDEIKFSLKSDKKDIIKSYINNLYDTAVQVHDVMVSFAKIDRIYFEKRTFVNNLGPYLVVAGAGLFLIDQFNTVVVQDQEASIKKNVAITSAALAGTGLALMLLKKRYQKIGGKYRLRMADENSVFYRPDHRRDVSTPGD